MACAPGEQTHSPDPTPQADGSQAAHNAKEPEHQRRFLRDEFRDPALTGFAFGGSMTESPVSRAARKKINRPWETWE